MSAAEKKKSGCVGLLFTGFFIIVAAIVGRFIGSEVGQSNVESLKEQYAANQPDPAIVKGLEQAAETLRSQLPKKVDEFTTMTDAKVDKGAMHYFLNLDIDLPDDQIDNARNEIGSSNRKEICSNENHRAVISLGGSYVWTYKLENGRDFTVHVRDCGS